MPTVNVTAPDPVVVPPLGSMGARVRRQRRRMGLTLDDLAVRAGMSKPYLSLIETGRVANPPSDEKLRRLEGALQFPAGELVSQAHLQRTPAAVRAVLADLLRTAGPLPPAGEGDDPLAAALRQLIGRAGNDLDALASVALASVAPAGVRPAVAPTGPPAIAAGAVSGFVGCPGLTDPAAYAAGVAGDAMAPRFHDGDLVVFSPAADVRPGDDCFVRLADGRTTFRRLFREPGDDGQGGGEVVRLQPRNERYRPLVVPVSAVAGAHRAVYRYEQLAADMA